MSQPFNKETAFDDLTILMNNLSNSAATASGAMKMIQAGQKFLQDVYDKGVVDGLELQKIDISVDDNNGQ